MTYRPRINTLALVAVGAALALAACDKDKKDEADKPAVEEPTEPPATDEPAEPATDEPAADLTPAEGDYVTVVADHTDKAKGPVDVAFQRFAVTEAKFDPANLEGGTATLVIDLASLKTDSEKRDKHLRSEDYLEVTAYPNATVKISDVKKKGDKEYTAKADVEVHGVTVSWPVTFEVVEQTDAALIVEGELPFKRSDIGVGPAAGEEDPVADEMAVKVRLTLPKQA